MHGNSWKDNINITRFPDQFPNGLILFIIIVLFTDFRSFRILSNYMMWRMVKDMVPFLSHPFTTSYQHFKNRLTGKSHKKTREETCFRYTDEILGPLVGGLFIRHEFSVGDKKEVEEMMRLIIESFEDNAGNVEWISGQTIKAVREKVTNWRKSIAENY